MFANSLEKLATSPSTGITINLTKDQIEKIKTSVENTLPRKLLSLNASMYSFPPIGSILKNAPSMQNKNNKLQIVVKNKLSAMNDASEPKNDVYPIVTVKNEAKIFGENFADSKLFLEIFNNFH